ncbi:MAG: NADH-quinone oxidoreductase subunit J [Bacteroidetes bacterium]|nr:NADH-quinone oxidoreductase subunit J [Bacteroidota bacterium]MBS1739327.1 NADH-quinone oxidoreductase subunit J [Bacteroidota bacterium]MBS1775627.1 NADH-quinone oxidoreductase subunit J [Bacteroidota bacterium]
MDLFEILFWILTIGAISSALGVILSRNPINSVICLIATFFAISGHYVLLNAQFLAVVNIIVYAGAIMVLFLFVIMLMNLNADVEPQKSRLVQFAGIISGGILFLVILAALRDSKINGVLEKSSNSVGLIENLGKTLFQNYVLPFEISSVLFLSAMIGAMVIGKKEPSNDLPERSPNQN